MRANYRWLAVLAVLAFGAPVHAQTRRCTSSTILEQDARNLFRVAARAAAPHILDKKLLWVCMYRGSGHAMLEAVPEAQPDGSSLEHTISCDRDAARWKCEVYANRYATIPVESSGGTTELRVHLPAGYPIAQANALARQAFDRAPALQLSDVCDYQPDKSPQDYLSQSLGTLKQLFSPSPDRRVASIDSYRGSWLFAINELYLQFKQLDTGDWQFECWSEYVVVT